MEAIVKFIRALVTSRTTQNVAAGGAVSAAAIIGVLQAVRSVWPGALQWKTGEDVAVAGALAALINIVVAPLVSRYLAFWRDPDKADAAALRKTLLCLALCAGLAVGGLGCATVATGFSEKITDAETGDVTETKYKAVSTAPPLAKLETSNHEWTYRWGGEENEIATGQQMQGLDFTAAGPIIEALIEGFIEAIKESAAAPVAPLP